MAPGNEPIHALGRALCSVTSPWFAQRKVSSGASRARTGDLLGATRRIAFDSRCCGRSSSVRLSGTWAISAGLVPGVVPVEIVVPGRNRWYPGANERQDASGSGPRRQGRHALLRGQVARRGRPPAQAPSRPGVAGTAPGGRLGQAPRAHAGGWLDERTAHVAAAEKVAAVEREREAAAEAAPARGVPTFARVAHEWLAWKRDVKGGAPSTLRENALCCASRATPYKRGTGTSRAGSWPASATVPSTRSRRARCPTSCASWTPRGCRHATSTSTARSCTRSSPTR